MNEIALYLRMMKWLLMHHDEVKYTFQPFLMAFLGFFAILIVEVVNIWNMVNIKGMKNLIFDYIALGIIADFDELFLSIFSSSFMTGIPSEMEVRFTKFRKQKATLAMLKKYKQIVRSWDLLMRGETVERNQSLEESLRQSEALEKTNTQRMTDAMVKEEEADRSALFKACQTMENAEDKIWYTTNVSYKLSSI